MHFMVNVGTGNKYYTYTQKITWCAIKQKWLRWNVSGRLISFTFADEMNIKLNCLVEKTA